jgi:hypothetical protein
MLNQAVACISVIRRSCEQLSSNECLVQAFELRTPVSRTICCRHSSAGCIFSLKLLDIWNILAHYVFSHDWFANILPKLM